MELSDYLSILLRRKWIILVTTVTAVLVIIAGNLLVPQTYVAESTIRIDLFASENPVVTRLIFADRIMNTYSRIATSSTTIEELRAQIGWDTDSAPKVKAAVIPDSELLRLTVEDASPERAKAIVQTLAEIVVQENIFEDASSSIIEPAKLTNSGSLTDQISLVGVSIILGLSGGLGLAFLIERFDDRLYSAKQIRATTEVPVLGEIPLAKGEFGKPLLADSVFMSDAFRRLRINVDVLFSDGFEGSLMIVSAEPDEGKSTVVVNLAASLAQADRKILIIDADLYRPTIHQLLNLPNSTGLSTMLAGDMPILEAIEESQQPGLYVLSSGPPIVDPIGVLASKSMLKIMRDAADHFDAVLLDTPAFLVLADVAALAPAADAVLLVARQGKVKKSALQITCRELSHVGAKLIGVAVNGVRGTLPGKYSKYYPWWNAEGIPGVLSGTASGDSLHDLPIPSDGTGHDIFSRLRRARMAKVVPAVFATPLPDAIQKRDRFTRIRGIGLDYQIALYDAGILTFAQLAVQDPQELSERIDKGDIAWRIIKDQWIEQAQTIARQEDEQSISRQNGPLPS